MKKFLQKKLKDQKGMTLIELLAVIVIIAIIAAIAIPAIGNIIENSRYGAIKGDASNVMAAADMFYADGNNGADPLKVTVSELKQGGYLDDAGSFTADSANTFVTKAVTGTTPAPTKISGKAVVGNVKLTFAGASRADANSIKKGTLPSTITVTQ